MPLDLNNDIAESFNQKKQRNKEIAQEYLKERNETSRHDRYIKLKTQVQYDAENYDFKSIILKLDEINDLKKGIIQKIDDKNNVLIRDARTALPFSEQQQVDKTSRESYLIQILNNVEAAKQLIDLEVSDENKKNSLKETLNNYAKNFINNFDYIQIPDKLNNEKGLLKIVNASKADIISLIESNLSQSHGKIIDKLNTAVNYQNLNYKSFDVITINKIDNHNIINIETSFTTLTNEQKEYLNSNNKEWFNTLSDFEKKLFKHYQNEIHSDSHVIPTQLTNLSVRNSFQNDIFYLKEKDKPNNMEFISTSKHTGAFSNINSNKNVRVKLTELNIKQAQAWVGNNKLHINTLNTDVLGVEEFEKAILNVTKKVSKNIPNVKHSNTAINIFRLFPNSNVLQNMEDSLLKIGSELEKKLNKLNIKSQDADYIIKFIKNEKAYQNISKKSRFPIAKQIRNYLQKRSIYAKIKNNIRFNKTSKSLDSLHSKINDPEIFSLLKLSVQTRKSINIIKSSGIESIVSRYKKHFELRLAEQFTRLSFKARKNNAIDEEVIVQCKSGKDRTGVVENAISHEAVYSYLKEKGYYVTKPRIMQEVLKGRVQIYNAGTPRSGGGTLGCYGLKPVNAPTENKKTISKMFMKSAMGNVISSRDRKQLHSLKILTTMNNNNTLLNPNKLDKKLKQKSRLSKIKSFFRR